MFGMFGLELRTVVMVKTGVVLDNGWTWFLGRGEEAGIVA